MAQPILREGVGSTLDDHGVGPVETHTVIHNFFEEFEVGFIINSFLERHVNSIILSNPLTNRVQGPSSRKEILIKLMETNSHDPIGMIKCFLNTVTVMHIDIQVEHSGMNFEHLENADDDVIDVAKP